ncbi:MAG: hypothetical protein OEZ34_13275 [Spirochaetia bacterium]|nr:hypothetical protein [Spirochaetia bacterium]
MHVKTVQVIFIFFTLTAAVSLLAEDREGLKNQAALPIETGSPGARRLLQTDFSGWEDRDSDGYERRKTLGFKSEFAINQYVSLEAEQSFTDRVKSETERMEYQERFTIGGSLSYMNRFSEGYPGVTFRLLFKDKIKHAPFESESDKYYLVQGQINTAIRIRNIDLGFSAVIQSETNKKFKEGPEDEFRRHYLFEFFFIWNLNQVLKLHLESAYRVPYNDEIDTDIRYWHIYPGISFLIGEHHNIGLSVLVPALEEGFADRGVRIRYAYIF